MSRPLEGKVAIVSGSSQGIGRAIAESLAAAGASCILCARNQAALAEVEQAIQARNGQAWQLSLDLRHPDSAFQLIEFTRQQAGRLDILVNNAGATQRGDFRTMTDEVWMDGFALKFFGTVRLTRSAWPLLRQARGSIVNIAGTGGRTPGPAFAVGGSVNAALLSLTKSLADTGREDGIQVNAINPGAVRTARLEKRLAEIAAREGIDLPAAEARMIADGQITRIGEPADIAALVKFLVSPEGRFLHGSLIDADGGATKTL